MKALLIASAAAALLAGCADHTGATRSTPASAPLTSSPALSDAPLSAFLGSPSSAPPPTVTSAAPTVVTATSARAASCAAFQTFYTDLTTLTPHAQGQLVADAEAVQAPLISAPGNSALLDDADDLVADVGSSDFPTQGNVSDSAIVKMQADCP